MGCARRVLAPRPFSWPWIVGGVWVARSGGPSWGQPHSGLPNYFLGGCLRFLMDAKETGSLGKELNAEQLLEQSKAEVGAGEILLPTLVNSLLPAASPGPSPSRAPGRCKVRPAGQGSRSPGMAASCQMKRLLFLLAVLQFLGE